MTMQFRVATRTECYQVRFIVPSSLTPKLLMMNLQISHAAARLAAPTVAMQDSIANFLSSSLNFSLGASVSPSAFYHLQFAS